VKSSGAGTAIRDLDTLFDVGATGALSDGQLLGRFVERREEAVFEAIVRRHGPMVWGVCRRVLRDHHDAEDAFQATFLVLARKAASVLPREKLGPWLYGVAYQTAMKARVMRAKRRRREVQVSDMPEPMAVPDELRDDLAESLDRELSRLPEKYRIPVVLCDLEGKTHREAAEQLGWPIGTVSGRLSRARAMLASRLSRRGVTLTVVELGALLAQESASASMPTRLISSTAQAASLFAAGGAATAGVVSAKVAALAGEMMKTMLLSKLKLIVVTVTFGVMVAGAAGLSLTAAMTGTEQTASGARVADDEAPTKSKQQEAVMRELERLRGTWVAVLAEEQDVRVPDEEIRREKLSLVITADEFIVKTAGQEARLHGTLKIDPTQQPSTMDWSVTGSKDGRAMEAKGIYELKGDTLKFCYGKERPEAFRTDIGNAPGYSRRLYVFERR
jgi:RNA polymerase sigma factor (sigma-70 family)